MGKPSKLRTIVFLFFATLFIFLDVTVIFAVHDLLMAYHHDGISIFPMEKIKITHDALWLILAGSIFLSTFLALIFLVLAIKSVMRNVFVE